MVCAARTKEGPKLNRDGVESFFSVIASSVTYPKSQRCNVQNHKSNITSFSCVQKRNEKNNELMCFYLDSIRCAKNPIDTSFFFVFALRKCIASPVAFVSYEEGNNNIM